MWEAWITVLSCRSRNISQKWRNGMRRSKKVYKHSDFRHRHTRDCQGWQHCVVIPLTKHLSERRERLRRWKNVLSIDRERKKDGRRLDRLYVIICITAMQLQVQFISHFHPVSSGFHFHTHAFRSLLRVSTAKPTVRDVTPTRAASRM